MAFLLCSLTVFAQPANDNCANASPIVISNGGYATGIFTSTQDDLTSATLQAGETFAASIGTAGLNKKSVWYKFTLPTSRGVRVSLLQPGSAIQAGNVGFAVYKGNNCVPGGSDLSIKLTPIETFGNTYHPCINEVGDYYIQVSGNNNANGPIYVTVELSRGTTSIFDIPVEASKFGKVNGNHTTAVQFDVHCQGLDDASEKCLPSSANHTKSTWHTFTTPDFFDWFGILLSSTQNLAINGNKIGFSLYEGDATVTPVASLIPIVTCDSLTISDANADYRAFRCGGPVKPNTTYTVKLLYPDYFSYPMRFAVSWDGHGATRAPQPVNTMPAQNKLGVLPQSFSGVLTTAPVDYMSCNSRHSLYNCPKSMPANGLSRYLSWWPDGSDIRFSYNLSNFYTFSLAEAANLNIGASPEPAFTNRQFYLRLYKQTLTGNCADLDTANIVAEGFDGINRECFAPGDYVLQVMGTDSALVVPQERRNLTYPWLETNFSSDQSLGLFHHLGTKINLNIRVTSQFAQNKYSLSANGKYDAVNANGIGMEPLASHTKYAMQLDTMGCGNTVVPDITCDNSPMASFHEFVVADSGSLTFTSWSEIVTRIYKGDANALATAQGKFNYPEKFTGLVPISNCIGGPHFVDQAHPKSDMFCITPGTFTLVGMSGLRDKYGNLNITHNLSVTFKKTKPKFDTPSKAEDMGDLWAKLGVGGGSFTSQPDTFSCYDNPATIDGLTPCKDYYGPANKLVYRQFYLNKSTLITIESSHMARLFSGKATDGLAGLKLAGSMWNCFTSLGSDCLELPAGWYTLVVYGTGPSFTIPIEPVNQGTNQVNTANSVTIKLKLPLCQGPSYNRPYKAAIDTLTNQPFLIKWGPRAGHTAAYPRTDTTYTLYTETFGCANDTPFSSHPVVGCSSGSGKVAYWVFKITQESFVAINIENYWDGKPSYAYSASVYAGDARTDSASFGTTQPIQPCLLSLGHMQICKMQPGVYTLVVFAAFDAVCRTVTPKIYIDQVGYSRFDHANNAYDFGKIKPDSAWYNGKTGDVNPLNPGRAASNDFFYCTTGAQPNDPWLGCASIYLPGIYNPGNNNPQFTSNYITNGYLYPLGVARNLWYTFTVDNGGLVRVRVNNKTIAKGWQYSFIVLKSNVDGTLPFSAVVSSGGVDSTSVQGLEPIANNDIGRCDGVSEISFVRESCTSTQERYYIVVANRVPSNRHNGDYFSPEWMYPNHQVEVSVLFDSVNAVPPKFDHYSRANNIGTNLGPGTYTGETDNFSCATRYVTEPVAGAAGNWPNCTKTLWYKFSTTVSGVVRYGIQNTTLGYFDFGNARAQLFREIIPGDSTSKGLQFIEGAIYNDGVQPMWQNCISPGSYYLLLPNCGLESGEEYPKIILTEMAGDFCSRPLVAGISGAGTKTATAVIDCHTIGTDYGEFNSTLTCPPGALTKNYKSTWFRLDIGGTDTLDVTVFINENTNSASSAIKYRMMTGNCNAMQEQSCVLDALTRNTYKCLAPGNSYFIQVFTPILEGANQVTGSIELNVEAVKKTAACLPPLPCIAVANFTTQFDCTKDRNVQFSNSSTYGTSIKYDWDFGYNNQKSTAIVPQFFYPALTTSATYTIRLVVTNIDCGKKDTAYQTITIPARPSVDLGRDTIICTKGSSIVLNATSHAGSNYEWHNGLTTPTLSLSPNGIAVASVEVTYNNCRARDTVIVYINPLTKHALQTLALCNVYNVNLNAKQGYGEAYKWNTGATTDVINAETPGYYWCDLSLNGCVIRDSFLVVNPAATQQVKKINVCQPALPYIADAAVSGATAYKWNDNSTAAKLNITKAGLYWVDVTLSGCTFRDTLIVAIDSFKTATVNERICQGQNYKMPSGKFITIVGTYKDSIRNIRGCDSLITTVTLVVDTVKRVTGNINICTGQTYTLPSGRIISTNGMYVDTSRNFRGCDSVISNINLGIAVIVRESKTAAICKGNTFAMPAGRIVSVAGIYIDTLKAKAGCDSLISTIDLKVISPIVNTANASICFGKTYTLPSGRVVSASGLYKDTVRYTNGCDSLIGNITVSVGVAIIENKKAFACEGFDYTLPSGRKVNASGIYKDTVRNIGGCDSLISSIDLTVQTVNKRTSNASICAGQLFNLPSGRKVNTTGIYNDTLRYSSGCDSVINTVSLKVFDVIVNKNNVSICFGKSYTLPSNRAVSTSGLYKDTVRYITGCDSLISNITLSVGAAIIENKKAFICEGSDYILPSGRKVNASGIYKDTVGSTGGCDSLISSIELTRQTVSKQNFNAFACSGQPYSLPAGRKVNITGIYNDTLRYISGCDSVINTIDLRVFDVITNNKSASFCYGQTYVLPSGRIASASGVYKDTISYANGCDSLVTNLTLTIGSITIESKKAIICEGALYTLPSGRKINAAGLYYDTTRTSLGCDSLYSSTDLTVQSLLKQSLSSFICEGQFYTLPSGKKIQTAGRFVDTARYTTGCDSIISTVDLTVYAPIRNNVTQTICQGLQYVLPSGKIAKQTGAYADTLKNMQGCDSLITTLNLTVTAAKTDSRSTAICLGQTYTLPSGQKASTSGQYIDTLRTNGGCDSLITTLNLTVFAPSSVTRTVSICQGQQYTMPGGRQLRNSGTYTDTIKNFMGCDSVITTVALTVNSALRGSHHATICVGKQFILPSGKQASIAGIYTDTIKNANGCDSIVTTTLSLYPALQANISGPDSVCENAGLALTATASGGNGGPYNYTWSMMGGSGNQFTTNLKSNTIIGITVSDGCTNQNASFNKPVTVMPLPALGFTVSPKEGCIPLTVQVFTTPPGGIAGAQYNWQFGDGGSATVATATHTYTRTGNFSITLQAITAFGCSASLQQANAVNAWPIPQAAFTIQPSPNTAYNTNIQFKDASNGTTKWRWLFGDGIGSDSIKNPHYQYADSGAYRVTLVVANQYNCKDTAYEVVEIEGYNGQVHIPNSFTPNDDGKNDVFRPMGLSIKSSRMSIYDRYGRIAFEGTGNPPAWDGRDMKTKNEYPSGAFVYYISVLFNDGQTKTFKGTVVLIR